MLVHGTYMQGNTGHICEYAERFFSALKRVKTYMRETMGGERLSDLLVICTETACAKNINFEILVASETSAGGEATCACAEKLLSFKCVGLKMSR